MMKSMIEKFRNKKKQAVLKSGYNGIYAFVGIGNHSLNNLYPVLDYLNVRLKYIVTRTSENAALVQSRHEHIIGTTDLKMVLDDPEIQGVFVCASPAQHFQLSKQILTAGKNLFVEKPPCSMSEELSELIVLHKSSQANVLIGLQKRYAPVYRKLNVLSGNTSYYSMKYQTGAYPEGNVLLDLFIHPLDLAVFLFGKAEPVSVQKIQRNKSCYSYLIHLKHENNVVGSLELSTDFSWTGAVEQIVVNTDKHVLYSSDTASLSRTGKPSVIAGIPMEKVKVFNAVTEQLYSQNNFLPVREHNQLYSSGFFSEIETFLNLCEGRKAENQSSPEQLQHTFELLDKIRD